MNKIFFSLIRAEILNVPLDEKVKNLITAENLSMLYTLSKRHDLAHLVGDALDKNGLLLDGSEVQKRFLKERNMAVYRYEQMRYELDCIYQTFENAKIPFIPLKGAVIRQYYPEPWMRTSCDIDLLVKETDLQAAIHVLKEKLGYRCDSIGAHDAQIYAPSGVHLELHYTLSKAEDKETLAEIFQTVWEYDKENSSYCRKMSDAMFYCYFLAHTANHVREGGCGVRPFLDVYFLQRQADIDVAERENLLQRAGLLKFAKEVEELAEFWFGGAETGNHNEDFAEYVLTGGVYGTMQNRVAVKTNTKQGKFRYLCSRIFLPYRELKFKYPGLQKWPILFPFYQVKRWFRLLKKDSRERSVRELKETTHGDIEKQQRVARLIKDLNL